MLRLCLICDSKAILTKATAQGITLLLSLINSALQQAQKGHEDAQASDSHLLINGLAAITPALPSALRVAEDIAKYHFGEFNCLCLRCGARFDDPEP
ncbi:hypothetical protein J2X66_005804 [Pseudomonas sp. 3296]|jgi:hypothetical protein|uniref:hypothetical protein n=1 Tax=Pseudomonas sp. 3296 TaxID=2817753 RepID=UPI0028670327|nr:hypothetical protein [Pseudomonas sp. 3296]MDR6918899.1 hypothetical protein [Pseudomonas sp. 3296]